jgi:ActR/RegA family two-component response regulator
MTGRLDPTALLQDRRLLIVQHDPLIRRALARYFRRLVGTVSVAADAAEADAVFNDTERSPTDLICGQDFGMGEPLGTTLVARWRDRHASLRRVILATGALTLPTELPGVDAVVSKPAEVADIVTQLLVA